MDNIPLSWARDVIRISLKGAPDFEDPGKDPRFRKLVEAVLLSRKIVSTYNYMLLAILAVFRILHFHEKRLLRKRARNLMTRSSADGHVTEETWSSSSSTIEGTTTPPDVRIKRIQDSETNETAPLLHRNRKTQNPRRFQRILWTLKAWIHHQPPPLPLINNPLPQNKTSLLILSFIFLNLFYNIYSIPLSARYLFIFADRAGLIFISNLPLLYLLSAKTQPLKLLTGMSYTDLNIFHRRLGELLCFEALLHFLGMVVVWWTMLSRIGFTLYDFVFNRVVVFGLGAFVAYQILYVSSLRSLRARWYEGFLALHVGLQVLGLEFLWVHYRTGRVYVGVSLFIFVVDRVLLRCWVKRSEHVGSLTVLPDGETVLVSANWDVSPAAAARRRFPFSLLPLSTKSGWNPMDHVFLTVMEISRFEAHPFTIFSAAPVLSSSSCSISTTSSHAWLTLLIRAQSGFTRKLLAHAHHNSTTTIRLDGPYGSSHALDILASSPNAIVVAGGSGIAVAYPLLWALLSPSSAVSMNYSSSTTAVSSSRQKVRLLWIVRESEHWEWLDEVKRRELVDWGLVLRLEGPTEWGGRPDVGAVVSGWVEEMQGAVGGIDTVGVVVSGPDGLVRDVRNACAACMGRGIGVEVCVEKFGW